LSVKKRRIMNHFKAFLVPLIIIFISTRAMELDTNAMETEKTSAQEKIDVEIQQFQQGYLQRPEYYESSEWQKEILNDYFMQLRQYASHHATLYEAMMQSVHAAIPHINTRATRKAHSKALLLFKEFNLNRPKIEIITLEKLNNDPSSRWFKKLSEKTRKKLNKCFFNDQDYIDNFDKLYEMIQEERIRKEIEEKAEKQDAPATQPIITHPGILYLSTPPSGPCDTCTIY